MKKLTLLFIGLVCVTQLWAQNNQKFIEITGETSYKKVPQKYIVDVVVSEALVYNNYNNETPNFEEIKTKYFDKLSKAGITLSTLKKDELGYLLTSYRKKGMNYTFETSNKDKFLSFLAVQSEGMQIQAKKLKFKEMNEAERQELMTKAISNAKAKASLLAKTLKKSLGAILEISDSNYFLSGQEDTYFNTSADQRAIYYVSIKYELK